MITVPSNAAISVKFPIRANTLGEVRITVSATSELASDALTRVVYVRVSERFLHLASIFPSKLKCLFASQNRRMFYVKRNRMQECLLRRIYVNVDKNIYYFSRCFCNFCFVLNTLEDIRILRSTRSEDMWCHY